jgi:PHD/YefM family antitoxin component YafN of YafNO toxin-antitoxin module
VDIEPGQLTTLVEIVVSGRTRIALRSGGVETVAVLISPADLDAIETTLAVYATIGAREGVSEGLADADADRTQDWLTLRAEHGRGEQELAE